MFLVVSFGFLSQLNAIYSGIHALRSLTLWMRLAHTLVKMWKYQRFSKQRAGWSEENMGSSWIIYIRQLCCKECMFEWCFQRVPVEHTLHYMTILQVISHLEHAEQLNLRRSPNQEQFGVNQRSLSFFFFFPDRIWGLSWENLRKIHRWLVEFPLVESWNHHFPWP